MMSCSLFCTTRNNVARRIIRNLRPPDGSGSLGRQAARNQLRERHEGKSEAHVRNLLAEMQRC